MRAGTLVAEAQALVDAGYTSWGEIGFLLDEAFADGCGEKLLQQVSDPGVKPDQALLSLRAAA